MEYEQINFDGLLGTPGFSDTMLKNHFKLYSGYVANTNKCAALLKSHKAGTPEFNEIKRRFGWEFNGMRMHELYFGNMGKEPVALEDGALKERIVKEFGSLDGLKEAFVNTGKLRGIGWVKLSWDPIVDRLFVVWVNEHDMGHFATGETLLVMDVWEHAYMTDYQLDRGSYMESFWKAINWKVVHARFEHVNH